MHITIINDCHDENARARQTARVAGWLQAPVSFVAVNDTREAGGNLIDILDAYGDQPAIVLLNVAPRNNSARDNNNGTPFGFFEYRNITVFCSLEGETLSLAKKLQLTDKVTVMEVAQVLEEIKRKEQSSLAVEDISRTQFRSFHFLPYAAWYKYRGGVLPGEERSVENWPDPLPSIWWVDNFGNGKTSLLSEELELKPGVTIKTRFGVLPFHSRLKDVPQGITALVEGSSGLEDKRFLEIVKQGGPACEELGFQSGSKLF